MTAELRRAWLLLLAGMGVMYLPTFWDLAHTLWASSDQGQGPLVLALSVWLLWAKRATILEGDPRHASPLLAWVLFVVGGLAFAVGRSQDISILEVGSFVVMVAACLLLLCGVQVLRANWFALFFLLFMIPLPSSVVDALTQPMKMAVSYMAEHLLFSLGYPISRTGVMLQIGPYQLLVADACAGLHTLFTLEAIGLLYLNVVRHSSALRNIGLAILIVPISFAANVIRVIVLSLITYYFGDAAGQGFLHGFAGMVLFLTALSLIISADTFFRAVQAQVGGKKVQA